MTPEKLAYARQLLAQPDRALSAIAKLVGVSRITLCKVLPELLPPELAEPRVTAQLPADHRALPTVAPYDKLLTRRTPLEEPISLGGHG